MNRLASLFVLNFKKILRVNLDYASFLSPRWPIYPEGFLQKNHWYNFHVPLASFHCGKF